MKKALIIFIGAIGSLAGISIIRAHLARNGITAAAPHSDTLNFRQEKSSKSFIPRYAQNLLKLQSDISTRPKPNATRPGNATPLPVIAPEVANNILINLMEQKMKPRNLSPYVAPVKSAPYASLITAASVVSNVPAPLLYEVFQQESAYRQDIITGKVNSPVGAKGIGQFMPATAKEYGINPLIPEQAIPATAKEFKRNYGITKSWVKALAAYNWGVGNVQRKGMENAPKETRDYVVKIITAANVNDDIALTEEDNAIYNSYRNDYETGGV